MSQEGRIPSEIRSLDNISIIDAAAEEMPLHAVAGSEGMPVG